MESADISVVIPAYNEAERLPEAVESAQAQTLAPREIIVVDDGSSDGTAAVARDLGVTVISQENRGLPGARNTGIHAAQGTWIALLDSDDIWEPEKLEKQWAAIQACPEAALVACDYRQFTDAGDVVHPSFLSQPGRYERAEKQPVGEGVSRIDAPGDNFLRGGYFLIPSATVFARETALAVGLFNESLRYVEDVEFFLRILSRGPLVMVESVLLNYRVHESNMSNDRLKMALGVLAASERILAAPQRYAEGADRYARFLQRRDLPVALRELLAHGRFAEARAVGRRHLRRAYSGRALAVWCAALAGPGIFNALLALKRRLGDA